MSADNPATKTILLSFDIEADEEDDLPSQNQLQALFSDDEALDEPTDDYRIVYVGTPPTPALERLRAEVDVLHRCERAGGCIARHESTDAMGQPTACCPSCGAKLTEEEPHACPEDAPAERGPPPPPQIPA